METLILSDEDVHRIALGVGLDHLMDELIDRLTKAFETFSTETTVVPARDGFVYDHPVPGLLEWMPCMTYGDRATVKLVGYHPGNPKTRSLPTILSTIGAYDTTSGHLICLMDGTLLTALRTGAASAVASSIMSAPGSRVLGLIGAGVQAIAQLHALSRTFDLEEVLIYDVDADVQGTFTERSSVFASHLSIRPATVGDLVRKSDVICTATSVGIGEGPVFYGVEPKPWVHLNAIGSDFPGKVEIPLDLLQRAFVCPDFRTQAIREGECQQLTPNQIGPDLFEVVQNRDRYQHVRDQITVFDSTGWALEDHVAMNLFMELAAELRLGTRVQIESIPVDAVNPNYFATSRRHETAQRRPTEPVLFESPDIAFRQTGT